TSTINLFLSGGVDIMCAMWYNEYNQIYLAGIDYEDLNAYFFFDYGLNFPEDGVYCHASFYKQNREACRNFVKATLEGWQYAFGHKEEALAETLKWMKYRNIPANAAHQRWMLNIMEKVYTQEDGSLDALLNRKDFIHTGEVLLESGSINEIPDFDQFNKTK
ncbi:MAG: ABC transporter substrate-binding protein, partial [Bacteroidales bacterium]